ncbi:neuroligin 1/2-like protein [Saccoglossus kowalevskii]|uniref:Neuroligin 1/2-like protein n=1 Tax=Saccoglossus kowalevskii TaxID=10224 RepID=D1LX81_SACKO|nr:neuroligin 1/2-like protein [Saccoglossus kowalevskii]ACY92587.1 neuroligin 1/2-like protein [Saccoglossus kowalevskii]
MVELKWDIFYVVCIYIILVVADKPAPVINTSYGQVRGKRVILDNPDLRDVDQYLGIPYAAPPTDSLRFREPLSPVRWQGIRNSTVYGPACPQNLEITENTSPWRRKYLARVVPYMQSISEDCLYLNIFKPVKEPSRGDMEIEKRPLAVMVFIHDGFYKEGSGNLFDGSVLAAYGDVIVVTFNYRLGILGFLSTEDEAAPGNFGLMDQILALQWIKTNIQEFGGNPTLITVFGTGTGGSCSHLLMLSNLTTGLIHRVIAQSGTAIAPWALANNPSKHTHQVTVAFDCERETTREIVECLRHVPHDELTRLPTQISRYYPAFGPVVDGYVILKDPLEILKEKAEIAQSKVQDDELPESLSGIPLMTGLVKSEAFNLIANDTDDRGRLEPFRYREIVKEFVESIYGEDTLASEQVAQAMDFEYTDWAGGKNNPYELRDGLIDAMTDNLYGLPVTQTAQLTSLSKSPIYLYSYGHRLKSGDSPRWTGATHGEELPFLCGAALLSSGMGIMQYNFSKSDSLISLAVMTYWSNFAKKGNPNLPVGQVAADIHRSYELKFKFENLHQGGGWPRFTDDHQEFIHIGSSPKVRDFYRSHKLAFWTEYVSGLVESAQKASVTSPPTEPIETEKPIHTTTISTTTTLPVIIIPKLTPPYEIPSLEPGFTFNITRDSKKEDRDYTPELSMVVAAGCALLFLNLVGAATLYYVKDKAAMDAMKAAGPGRTTNV